MPEVVQLPARRMAVMHANASTEEVPATFARIFPAVYAALTEQGVTDMGHVSAVYHSMDANQMELSAGIEIGDGVEPNEPVELLELPACDAVVASLALHHVATLAEKARVFAAIFAALRPGGVFVNADATMSADPGTRRAEYEAWAAHLVSSGIEEKRAWRHFEEWSGEDTYLPVEDELAALESAGFAAECLWRVVPITVVKAVKPGAGGG